MPPRRKTRLGLPFVAAALLLGCSADADGTASTTAAASAAPDAEGTAEAGATAPPAAGSTAVPSATSTPAGPGTEGTGAGQVAAGVDVPSLHPSVDGYRTGELELRGPGGDVEAVHVLVAETAQERRHGLMEVEELPGGVGMLFVYDEPRELTFWMKNTLVHLDLAAIAPSGEITDIVAMEPCPAETDCPRYHPDGEAVAGLETAQGWLDEIGAEPGWSVCVRSGGVLDALACAGEE